MKSSTLNNSVSVGLKNLAPGYRSIARIMALMMTMVFAVLTSFAQVVPVSNPTGGFNINGGLTARSGYGDWAPGTGSGGYVLDAGGNPVDPWKTRLVKDAYDGNDLIFQGSKFNANPNTGWTWTEGKAGGKGDINNAMFHLAEDPATSKQWLFVAGDRMETGGTSYIDFEFLQNTLTRTPSTTGTGGFFSAGNNGGRTMNDAVISMEYSNGGSAANIRLYLWKEVPVGSNSWEYVLQASIPAGSVYGLTNIVTEAVPFQAFGVSSYEKHQFAEAAVNITDLFGYLDPCLGIRVKTIVIKTKSSDVVTANLDDFVEPIQVSVDLGTASISYAGPFCPVGVASVLLSGISGGTFSAPAGLVINSATGEINLATSTPGSYLVTYTFITPTCATPKTATTTVIIPSPVVASLTTKTDISCFGALTGAIDISVAGGVAPYSYAWTGTGVSTGSQDQSGLEAGIYEVVVTDQSGCTSEKLTVTLNQPSSALTAVLTSKTNVLCFDGETGAIDITVSGGTTGYTYAWTKDGTPIAQTSQDLLDIKAGTYYLTVTDSKNCTANVSVVITQPAAITFRTPEITHVNCFGENTGAIVISATGGTGTITYSILPAVGAQSPSGTFTGLTAQDYTVTATDANGCTATSNITITQPAAALTTSITAQTDVLCFGDATGSVTVAGANGTAPYEYSLDGGTYQASGTFSPLAAGTYTVTVKDSKGCTKDQSVEILQPDVALTASITAQTNVKCFGEATGTATIAGANGTSPYEYSLDGGTYQTSGTFSALIAGDYIVTVKDKNGCTIDQPFSITEPGAALTTSITAQTDILCFGNSTGSVTVAGANGTDPYEYSLDGGTYQTSGTFSALAAGDYVVTVKDNNGCTKDQAVSILTPAVLVASIGTPTHVLCFGGSTGSATASANGGVGPYSYSWNTVPAQLTATATGLKAGNYIVTVTDANLCTDTESVTITEPAAAVLASIGTPVNVLCFGGSTGSATASATGGVGPYSYSWNTVPAQLTATATGLKAGNYIVTVTDANLCTDTESVTITEPAAAVLASIGTPVNVLCFGGSTGSATASATGGVGPYSYSWNTVPAQLTATATGLKAGNYIVTVTDANLCTDTESVTITEPAAAVLASIGTPVNVLCFGGSTGSATASATGGVGPYSYSWNTVPAQLTATATGLKAGNYIVTVTDANLCTDTESVTITEPESTVVASIGEPTNVLCFGGSTGSATASATGGVGPYSYSWNTVPAQLTATATGLKAGNYIVTVTDANLCTDTESVTITEPEATVIASIGTPVNVLCFGESTGSATASATGGVGPYSYSWNTVPAQLTATATGLKAGNYIVTVTDANLCTDTESVTITEPAAAVLASIGTPVNVLCFGGSTGSATASATGGVGPYSYSWNTVPAQLTATATGLKAGNYIVTVTDANLCTDTESVTITEPAAAVLASIGTPVNVLCFGGSTGSATASATGGVGPYSYSWNTVPAQLTATATGLKAGNYIVTVTDANLCTDTESVTITEPAAAVLASIGTPVNVLCFGGSTGSATASATGGVGPYSYSWNTVPAQLTATATGLKAGNYIVTVTDANLCTDTESVTITEPAAAVLASIGTPVNVLCFGGSTGSATASATGGVGPYSYSWNTVPAQLTATATGLKAGNYIVTVTDANLCTDTESVTITEPAAAVLASIGTPVNVLCFGGSTGSATASATGGVGPYSYSWNTVPAQLTATATGLKAGNYIVTVTDANLCTDTETVTITEPASAVGVTTTKTDVVCTGGSTGTATAIPTGGTGSYSYSWDTDPIQTSVTATGLKAGTYTVTVTDANGCTKTASAIVGESPVLLSLLATPVPVTCSTTDGAINLTVTGGTAPFIYAWTGPGTFTANTEDLTDLASGIYSVTVTDSYGCVKTTGATVNRNEGVLALNAVPVDETCPNYSNGSISVTVTGGTAPFKYSWSNGATTEDISGLAPGAYTLMVTDALGCVKIVSATVQSTPDNTPPVIICPANITKTADPGTCTANVTLTNPSVTDNCSSAFGFTGIRSDGLELTAPFQTGVTTITWTASDASSNISESCVQTVTITDTEKPVIVTCTADQSVIANTNCLAEVPDFTNGVNPTDNCTIRQNLVVTQSPVAGTLVGKGVTVVTITVKDASGNEAVCLANLTVKGPIVANDDIGETINGITGGISFVNILLNDQLNCTAVNLEDVNLTFINSSSATVRLVGTNVVVDPGTPAGIYYLNYRICEKLNPTSCDEATVTVPVEVNEEESVIDAIDDFGSANGLTGGTAVINILSNDLLNGSPVDPTKVTLTFLSSTSPKVTINGYNVVVAPLTPNGTYQLFYRICEIANPDNCDDAIVTVLVSTPIPGGSIDAIADAGTVNGLLGGIAIPNVLVNDELDGKPFVPSKVNLSFISSTHDGVTLSGSAVVVAPGTPAGIYYLVYNICDKSTIGKCDQTTDTITVKSGIYEGLTIRKSELETTFGAVGDVIHYTIEVMNAYDDKTFYNILVTDPNAEITSTNSASVLPGGLGLIINAIHTITQADIDAGEVLNTAYLTGNDSEGLPIGLTSNTVIATGVFRPQLTATKFVSEATYWAVGETIHYTIEVFNCGNVIARNIVATDPNAVITSGSPIASLLPRQTMTINAEHVVTQADLNAGKIVNVASVSGIDPKGQPVGDDSNEVTIFAKLSSMMIITQSAVESKFSKIGDTLHYNILIKNPSNLTIPKIDVISPNSTITSGAPIFNLVYGKTATVTAVHAITQEDLNAGKVVTFVLASAKNPDNSTYFIKGNEVTVFADLMPGLMVTKTAQEASYSQVGDVIHYTNEIENTGNVKISSITFNDPNTTLISSTPLNSLEPGEVAVIKTAHVISQSDLDIGMVERAASVTGNDPNNQSMRAVSNRMTVRAARNARLTANLISAENTYRMPGDVIHYTVEIRNTGNVTLTNLSATGPVSVFGNARSIASLVPGANAIINAEYAVTQSDLTSGKLVNMAVVAGYNPAGQLVRSVSNELTLTANVAERLTVSKVAQETSYAKPGDLIHYTLTVKNHSNVSVSNIMVAVPDAAITGKSTISVLAPSASATLSAVHTVTQDDLDAGLINNAASITGTYPDGKAYTEQSNAVTVYGMKNPMLTAQIVTAQTSFLTVGELINYTIEIKNTGNQSMTDVMILGQGGLNIVGGSVNTLAPGKTAELSAVYTVTANDLDAGVIVKSVNVNGKDPDNRILRVPSNEATVAGVQNPELTTTAMASENTYSQVGEIIHYTIQVKNTGNVSIISTAVTDPNAVIVTVRPITILYPGEVVMVAATHLVTQADLNAGKIVSQAKAAGFDQNGNTIEKSANKVTVFGTQVADMVISNDVSRGSFKKTGDVIDYTIQVKNSGNITIYNLNVTDPSTMINLEQPVKQLLPGETTTVTGSHVVSQSDLDAGKVISAAKAGGFDLNGKVVEKSANRVTTLGIQRPDLTTTSEASAETYKKVGDVIVYTVLVENTGNVTMENIHITDVKDFLHFDRVIASLAPGETVSVDTEYPITISDINSGEVITAIVANAFTPGTQKMSYTGNELTVRMAIDNFNLSNYPNPFSYETTITFDLTEKAKVILKVYDMTGREVGQIDEQEFNQGRNYVTWKSINCQKGLYVLKMISNGAQATRILSITN